MRRLLIIFIATSFLFAGMNRKIRKQFPEIYSIDSIQSSDDVIVARIDFDFQDALNQFDSTFYNEKGPDWYSKIVARKNNGDSLSDFDKECLELGEERAIKEKIYDEEFSWSFGSIIFDVFANKSYFNKDVKVTQADFDSVKATIIQELQLTIASIQTEDAASLFLQETEDRNEKINYYPIALFLAKNGDSFCWIYVESWEYNSPRTNPLDGSIYPYAPLGHIQGTFFNFDFTEEIGHFQCG